VRFELCVELVEHDAGLDAGPALLNVQLQNASQVFRCIDDKACANRLSRLRCSAPAQRQRTALSGADSDDVDEVVTCARENDPSRLDLIDAGVGGIQRTGDPVEADFPAGLALQFSAKVVQRFSS
jgi:hypothetical protein